MVMRYPYKICWQPVANNSDSIQSDKCDIWVHRKCNKINKQTYEYLKQDKSTWYCIVCTKEIFPFSKPNEEILILTLKGKTIKFVNVAQKRILEKTQFLQQINLGAESEQNVNITSYFNPNELKELPDKENFLKVFHLNISSLPYHCSELHSLLSECNIDFNVIGITESRIKRNQKALSNIEIPNYKVEQCSTESANGGTLLYIKNIWMHINLMSIILVFLIKIFF